MRRFVAKLNITLDGDEDDIRNDLGLEDDEEITADNIEEFFNNQLEHYASSNDGSEMIANAGFTVETIE